MWLSCPAAHRAPWNRAAASLTSCRELPSSAMQRLKYGQCELGFLGLLLAHYTWLCEISEVSPKSAAIPVLT